jgi:hypothetical protein
VRCRRLARLIATNRENRSRQRRKSLGGIVSDRNKGATEFERRAWLLLGSWPALRGRSRKLLNPLPCAHRPCGSAMAASVGQSRRSMMTSKPRYAVDEHDRQDRPAPGRASVVGCPAILVSSARGSSVTTLTSQPTTGVFDVRERTINARA